MRFPSSIQYRICKYIAPRIRDKIQRHERQLVLSHYKLFFIFGHMRTGSSLLIHLLANNPQVSTFGESHIIYDWPGNFSKLIERNRPYLNSTTEWVADKVLHSYLHSNNQFLLSNFIDRIVIMYREPSASISSMIKNNISFGKGTSNLDHYTGYYISRLAELKQIAALFGPEKTFFLSYEELIQNTENVLLSLSQFLSLKTSLSKDYALFDKSGLEKFGDPSKDILRGTIVSDKPIEIIEEFDFPITRIAYDNFVEFRKLFMHSKAVKDSFDHIKAF